jgi:hypothetical protein
MRGGTLGSGIGAWPPAPSVSSALIAHPSCNAKEDEGRNGAIASAASVRPAPANTSIVRWMTGVTSASIISRTSASGVSLEMVWMAPDTAIVCLTLLHPMTSV